MDALFLVVSAISLAWTSGFFSSFIVLVRIIYGCISSYGAGSGGAFFSWALSMMSSLVDPFFLRRNDYLRRCHVRDCCIAVRFLFFGMVSCGVLFLAFLLLLSALFRMIGRLFRVRGSAFLFLLMRRLFLFG